MIEEITENVKDQMSISSKFQEFHQLIHQGFLKKLQFGEDRPYTKVDFSSDLNNRLDILNQLHLLLTTQKSLDVNDCEFKKSVLVPIVLLCGENVQPSDWTTSQHIQISYIILTVLKREIFKEDSITKIFQVHPEFLQWSLTELRLKLGSQNEWKNYPGAQYCFSWILRQLNSFQNLPEFLPFVLKFGDDWEIKNKIFALHCLQHILENSTKSDLVKFGYDQVLKSTLFQLLTFRELELCKVTFPVIFKFLKMCWPKIDHFKYGVWDELTQKLLYQMETESNLELKRVYGRELFELLNCLGIGATRWLTSLLSLISSYTQSISDQQCRIDALENLEKLMEFCEERLKFHADTIFEILLRLLYEISQVKHLDSNEEKMLKMIGKLAKKMKNNCSDEEFALHCQGLDEVHVNEVFDRVISDLYSKPQLQ